MASVLGTEPVFRCTPCRQIFRVAMGTLCPFFFFAGGAAGSFYSRHVSPLSSVENRNGHISKSWMGFLFISDGWEGVQLVAETHEMFVTCATAFVRAIFSVPHAHTWLNRKTDVIETFLHTCHVCQKNKHLISWEGVRNHWVFAGIVCRRFPHDQATRE